MLGCIESRDGFLNLPPFSVGGQIVPDAEMQLTHQNSLLLVGSWNQSSHCRFFSHANVWEVCQPVNEHGQNEGKPWRGLQGIPWFFRMFRDCSIYVSFSFIHCHPVYWRLVLLPSAVSVSNQLSLWSAGGTLGLDVPVRNIPT